MRRHETHSCTCGRNRCAIRDTCATYAAKPICHHNDRARTAQLFSRRIREAQIDIREEDCALGDWRLSELLAELLDWRLAGKARPGRRVVSAIAEALALPRRPLSVYDDG